MSTSKAGLGRPVKLVYYDDQSNSATVSALYQEAARRRQGRHRRRRVWYQPAGAGDACGDSEAENVDRPVRELLSSTI